MEPTKGENKFINKQTNKKKQTIKTTNKESKHIFHQANLKKQAHKSITTENIKNISNHSSTPQQGAQLKEELSNQQEMYDLPKKPINQVWANIDASKLMEPTKGENKFINKQTNKKKQTIKTTNKENEHSSHQENPQKQVGKIKSISKHKTTQHQEKQPKVQNADSCKISKNKFLSKKRIKNKKILTIVLKYNDMRIDV